MAIQELVKKSVIPWSDAKEETLTTAKEHVHELLGELVSKIERATDNDTLLEIVESVITLFASKEFRGLGIGASNTEPQSSTVFDQLERGECPSSDGFQSVAVKEPFGNVPEGQLARICDVAVLKVLCRCSHSCPDGSTYRCLTWALSYVNVLLGTLSASASASGVGWYGAKIRMRKGPTQSDKPPGMTADSLQPPVKASTKVTTTHVNTPAEFRFDIDKEMMTCVTSEGKISLLVILSAIKSLPEKILDISLLNRIRPLLQWCLDLGVPNHPTSPPPKNTQEGRPTTIEEAGQIYCREIVNGVLDIIAKCLCKSNCCKTDSGTYCQMQARVHFGDDESKNSELKQCVHSMQDKYLQRIFNVQMQHYRKWLINFVDVKPIGEVFTFLHSILGYCSPNISKEVNQSSLNVAAATAAIAFRPVLDKFTQFDLTFSALESSFLRSNIFEVCQYISYCQHLRQPSDMPALESVRQLHMQVQRVALSAIFAASEGSCVSSARGFMSSEQTKTEDQDSNPTKDHGATHGSDELAATLKRAFMSSNACSTPPGNGISMQDQNTLSQSSIKHCPLPDRDLSSLADLGSLHLRLQRLSVLMELSEPGTVPSADMLASMLDFTGKASVVARAAVFVECAHFVHRLKSGTRTAWVISGVGNHRTALLNFKRWGEVIGAKLQDILTKERQPVFVNGGRNLDTASEGQIPSFTEQILEEPVLETNTRPQHPHRKQKKMSVCFALKAAVCQLLYEISLILLDPPRMYQVSLHSHLDHSQGSQSLSVSKSSVDADLSQSKFSFKRRGGRASMTRSQQYDDVVRRTIRHHSANVSVVFTEASSDAPQSLPTPQDVSADTHLTRSNQRYTKSGQLGNRLTQNFSKLISSIGLRGTQHHTGTTRRKSMLTSGGHRPSVSRRKSMYMPMAHETIHLPWLESVAELLHPSTICNTHQQLTYFQCFQNRKKQCAQLSFALTCIYRYKLPDSQECTEEEVPVTKKERKSSKWTLHKTYDSGTQNRKILDPRNESPQLPSSPLSSFSLGQDDQLKDGVFNLCVGYLSLPVHLEQDALLVSMEKANAVNTSQQIKAFSTSRLHYMEHHMSTLFAPIFSTIMVQSEDLADKSSLRDILWECLLDKDKEVSSLASALFLLVCEKSNLGELHSFFQKKMDKGHEVLRFRSLWKTRYKVFPKIPRDVQRRIRSNELHLGYALPTPQLGNEIKEIPLAPWQPITLCSGECKHDSKKCNAVTEFSPVLIHSKDILALVSDESVSSISVPQKASTDSSRLVFQVDEQQQMVDSADRAWQFALFPDSLLPLVLRVLSIAVSYNVTGAQCNSADSLSNSATRQSRPRSEVMSTFQPQHTSLDQCQLSTMIAARDLIHSCLVDDYILFFQPFLHLLSQAYHECWRRAPSASGRWKKQPQVSIQSNVLEDTDYALHGLRLLLLACPTIPPEAGRYLFNHLIGIVMQYCLHHNTEFQRLIATILDMLQLLSTSVQGLNIKLLKNTLKKEASYPTIMTTARISGLNKATVFFKKSEKAKPQAITLSVSGDMTAQDLLVKVHQQLRLKVPSIDPLSRYTLHMVPKEFENKKFLPSASTKLCGTLVLRDHFVTRGEPTLFDIEEEDSISQKSFEREQVLHYWMSEMQRLVFARKLLKIGHKEQEAFNFMHAELIELSSFPRKVLDSVYSLPALVDIRHLRSSDVMLKGSWLQFICSLFQASPEFFKWSSDLMLFLSAISGSLLLHAEEASVLRLSLAAFLSVISRFPAVIKDEAAELIISTTIQVYAVHGDNELISNSLCHLWSQLHTQRGHEYEFLLEVPNASLALLREDTSSVPNTILQQGQGSFVAALLMHRAHYLNTSKESLTAAVFKLLNALGSHSPPPDVLGIEEVAGVSQIARWQPTSMSKIFNLYVTVIHAGPEKLRGMQTMLFLEYITPLMIKQLSGDSQSIGPFIGGVKNLAKACEHLGIHAYRLRNEAAGNYRETQGKLISLFAARKSHNKEKNVSSSSSGHARTSFVRRPSLSVDAAAMKRIKQDNLLSSVNSMAASLVAVLNVATEVLVASKRHGCSAYHRLSRRESHYELSVGVDTKTVTSLSTVAIQVMKQLSYSDSDLPPLDGFMNFTTKFLPSVDWNDEANHSCFEHYLYKVTRLMHRLTADPNRTKRLWPSLTAILTGISTCIENPQLAQAHMDSITNLIDTILHIDIIVHAGSLISSSEDDEIVASAKNAMEFLKMISSDFSRSFVGLCKRLLVVSCASDRRYCVRNIFHDKARMQNEVAKALMVRKVLIPLLIAIGEEQDYELDVSDVNFLMEAFSNYARDIMQVMTSGHNYPLQDSFKAFFLGIKVMCTTLYGTLTTHHWLGLAQTVIRIGLREKVLRKRDGILFDDLIIYYKELLYFIEDFVLIHACPLRVYIWPVLDTVESGLKGIQSDLMQLSDSMQQTTGISVRTPLEETGKQLSTVEDQLLTVDTSLQICQRIKDSFLEDYEHKTNSDLLEGFDTELHGGLFKISEAPEPRSRRNYRRARHSISDYLSRTKQQIFSTLGSSSFSKSEDMYKIEEESELDGISDVSKTIGGVTNPTTVLESQGSDVQYRRYRPHSNQSKSPTAAVLSSDSDDETLHVSAEKLPRFKFRNKRFAKQPKEVSYEADNELQSPLNPEPLTLYNSGKVSVEIHGSISSASSEALSLPHSRRTSTSDSKAVKKQSISSLDSSAAVIEKQSQVRKLSEGAQPMQGLLQPLPPSQRVPSPILVSHRASPNANHRRRNLQKSYAMDETNGLSDINSSTEAMIEPSSNHQQQPLLPNHEADSADMGTFHNALLLANVIKEEAA